MSRETGIYHYAPMGDTNHHTFVGQMQLQLLASIVSFERFMQIPILDFGLDHSGSQPFNYSHVKL